MGFWSNGILFRQVRFWNNGPANNGLLEQWSPDHSPTTLSKLKNWFMTTQAKIEIRVSDSFGFFFFSHHLRFWKPLRLLVAVIVLLVHGGPVVIPPWHESTVKRKEKNSQALLYAKVQPELIWGFSSLTRPNQTGILVLVVLEVYCLCFVPATNLFLTARKYRFTVARKGNTKRSFHTEKNWILWFLT